MLSSDNHALRSVGPNTVSRHDAVLAAIPLAFLAGVLLSLFTSVPLHLGMAVSSVVGVFAVADGLFFNPPRSPGAV